MKKAKKVLIILGILIFIVVVIGLVSKSSKPNAIDNQTDTDNGTLLETKAKANQKLTITRDDLNSLKDEINSLQIENLSTPTQ